VKTITIRDTDAGRTMEIVRELRTVGLVQGTDFDFSYYQSRWDEMIGEIPTTTIFTFYTEKWASWFALKYAS
jgi:hypothetical protein